MIRFRKALLGAAVVVVLAAPTVSFAVKAVMFDNGNGPVLTTQFNWEHGNVLLENVIPGVAPTVDGTVWGQTTLSDAQGGAGRKFTYQYQLPVTSNFVPGPICGLSSRLMIANDMTRTGFFRMFVDTDLANGAPDPTTGFGYGGAGGGDHSGIKLILSGVVRLDSVFSIEQTAGCLDISSLGTETTGIGKTVSTLPLNGTAALDIDVTEGACDGTLTDTSCVDHAYFLTDISSLVLTPGMANTADMTIPVYDLGAPFGAGNPASPSVVGVAGFFGDPQVATQVLLPSNAPVPVVVNHPINDFVCNVHLVFPGGVTADVPGPGPCDIQVESGSAMFINHEIAAPEPGSFSLLTIGLGIVGLLAHRRRRIVVI